MLSLGFIALITAKSPSNTSSCCGVKPVCCCCSPKMSSFICRGDTFFKEKSAEDEFTYFSSYKIRLSLSCKASSNDLYSFVICMTWFVFKDALSCLSVLIKLLM